MDIGLTIASDRLTKSARVFLLLATAVAVTLTFPATASAGLIVDSLRYDGQVSDGINTGVEEHFTDVDFPPPNTNIPLPATGDPPAPLDPANDLSMTATQTIESVNSQLFNTAIVQISNQTGFNIFANELDSLIALPVEFEAFVYLDDLQPGDKLVIASVGIENNNLPPFGDPGTSLISDNRGSIDDPIQILLGLSASQVSQRRGFVKLHLRYDTMPIVPEPATWALLAIGIAGFAARATRKRYRG